MPESVAAVMLGLEEGCTLARVEAHTQGRAEDYTLAPGEECTVVQAAVFMLAQEEAFT
ncbi:hypothetical protein [Bradyrhizobium sp. ERR14]|uniref:hypothetical protein n=1 Tax=Bradyrhizobium sp. ERR14 TaxID=2663837 RepID=UPI00160FC15D|nr:hypothetical protein [Bradyrhizobium sp. ERR14]MBB4391793.1 hypothetical protein [Bradyrhizobium sp. ERR14]